MLCNNYQYRYFLKCCSKVPFITSIIIIMIINKNSQVTLLCFFQFVLVILVMVIFLQCAHVTDLGLGSIKQT